MTTKCARCGSDKVHPAAIEGAAIRLEESSTLKKVFNVGGLIRCDVCVACGAVENLRGDPEALAKMLA